MLSLNLGGAYSRVAKTGGIWSRAVVTRRLESAARSPRCTSTGSGQRPLRAK
jgi:hypothetical protein